MVLKREKTEGDSKVIAAYAFAQGGWEHGEAHSDFFHENPDLSKESTTYTIPSQVNPH
jgi:hypothetical protein